MNVCDNCVNRLFNNKHYNLQGIGNPYLGNCIIVPNVDYNAYKKGDMSFSNQVEIISSIISSTGEVNDVYILPFIRCNESISCEINDDVINKCMIYLANDFRKYNFRYILLLGNVVQRFLHCNNIKDNLDNIFISKNKRCYNVNYSPLIKYIDEKGYDIFKEYLLKWYNSVNNKIFNYNIMSI